MFPSFPQSQPIVQLLLLGSGRFQPHSGCEGEHGIRENSHGGTCLHFLLKSGCDGYTLDCLLVADLIGHK